MLNQEYRKPYRVAVWVFLVTKALPETSETHKETLNIKHKYETKLLIVHLASGSWHYLWSKNVKLSISMNNTNSLHFPDLFEKLDFSGFLLIY